MKLYTSYYFSPVLLSSVRDQLVVPVSISRGLPKKLPYSIVKFPIIMPTWSMIKMQDKSAYYYLYKELLEQKGSEYILSQLLDTFESRGKKPLALLCYESLTKQDEWCHRTMFAEWFTEKTGIPVDELVSNASSSVSTTPNLFGDL